MQTIAICLASKPSRDHAGYFSYQLVGAFCFLTYEDALDFLILLKPLSKHRGWEIEMVRKGKDGGKGRGVCMRACLCVCTKPKQ